MLVHKYELPTLELELNLEGAFEGISNIKRSFQEIQPRAGECAHLCARHVYSKPIRQLSQLGKCQIYWFNVMPSGIKTPIGAQKSYARGCELAGVEKSQPVDLITGNGPWNLVNYEFITAGNSQSTQVSPMRWIRDNFTGTDILKLGSEQLSCSYLYQPGAISMQQEAFANP
jgi:hypothetical protein